MTLKPKALKIALGNLKFIKVENHFVLKHPPPHSVTCIFSKCLLSPIFLQDYPPKLEIYLDFM